MHGLAIDLQHDVVSFDTGLLRRSPGAHSSDQHALGIVQSHGFGQQRLQVF